MTYNEESEALCSRMRNEMLTKMLANAHKGGWQDTSQATLFKRLLWEVGELMENPSWQEAADVANFAAMIADNQAALALHLGEAERNARLAAAVAE